MQTAEHIMWATARCCRDWPVDANTRIGRCGECGQVPQIIGPWTWKSVDHGYEKG